MSSYSDSDYLEETHAPHKVDLDVEGVLTWEDDNAERSQKLRTWILDGARKGISVITAIVILSICLISFYCVVIVNFVFFVSSMLSYGLSPFYQGLCGNWWKFVFSIIQVIVTCPYIQFYIIFIISSVKQFIDSIPSFRVLFKVAWNMSIELEEDEEGVNYEPWYTKTKTNEYCCNGKLHKNVAWILIGIGCLLACFIFIWLSIKFKVVATLPGLALYVIIILQIALRVHPMWRYWWIVIVYGHAKRSGGDEHNCIRDLVGEVDKKLKNLKGDGRILEEREVQTHNSYFARKYLDDVYVRSDSDDSDSLERNDGGNEAEKQKQKARVEHQNDMNNLSDAVRGIFLAKYYKKIYQLGVMILEDPINTIRKRIIMITFTVLNFAVIIFDICRAAETPDAGFILSIIFRFLCIPVASYFNVFTVFFYRLKTKFMFNATMVIGAIFTGLIVLGSIVAIIYTTVGLEAERIDDLPLPSKYREWNRDKMSGAVCTTTFNGVNLIDIVSLAFGAYDIARNKTIFDNQMVHFFGEDWTDKISYEVKWINEQVPVVVYDLKEYDTRVFGFRGFASGSELAFQGELFMIYKAIPFIQDIVVFYDYMVSWFIEPFTIRANNFGFHFFDPQTIVNDLMDSVLDICREMKVDETPNAIFVGANSGGVLAKLAGMITHRQSISFISFPVANDFFIWEFDLDKDRSNLITNIYNYEGSFTEQEPGIANNIGVPWVPTSTVRRDSVYQSFCTLAVSCGSDKYEEYCRSVIGDDMNEIHQFFAN